MTSNELKDLMLVVTPFISVLGTLGGVSLGYIFNERRTNAQNVIEERKENRKNFLIKGEELYQLISEWTKYINGLQFLYLQVARRVNSYEDISKYHEANQHIARVHDRLDTLIGLYFSDMLPQLNEITKEISNSTKIFKNIYGNKENPDDLINVGLSISKKLKALRADVKEKMALR